MVKSFIFNFILYFLIHEPQTNDSISKFQNLNRKKQIASLPVTVVFIYHSIRATYKTILCALLIALILYFLCPGALF